MIETQLENQLEGLWKVATHGLLGDSRFVNPTLQKASKDGEEWNESIDNNQDGNSRKRKKAMSEEIEKNAAGNKQRSDNRGIPRGVKV